jgi:hypothetical protein
MANLLDLGGTSRTRGEMQKVREPAESQGWSRRKRPRPEGLRPGKRSGSVTS